jgi:flagellin-specific chaperone FliS
MIIAKEKRNQNIVEYLLYMYQVEDLLRAARMDISIINDSIVQKYDQPEDIKLEILQWYEDHIELLKDEGKQNSGHLTYLENLANDLNELHLRLLSTNDNKEYTGLYTRAIPSIHELKSRSKGINNHEIKLCLNGLYGYLLLKLRGENISRGTTESIKDISKMMALLAIKYHKIETGKEEIL